MPCSSIVRAHRKYAGSPNEKKYRPRWKVTPDAQHTLAPDARIIVQMKGPRRLWIEATGVPKKPVLLDDRRIACAGNFLGLCLEDPGRDLKLAASMRAVNPSNDGE